MLRIRIRVAIPTVRDARYQVLPLTLRVRTRIHGISACLAFRRLPRQQHVFRILLVRTGKDVDVRRLGVVDSRTVERMDSGRSLVLAPQVLHRHVRRVDIRLVLIVHTRRIGIVCIMDIDTSDGVRGVVCMIEQTVIGLANRLLRHLDEDRVLALRHDLTKHQPLLRIPVMV